MMVFRRKRDAQLTAPPPEWRSRVDAAVAIIQSRPRPAWIDGRLNDLERALTDAQADVDRLGERIARLDPDQTSQDLKRALRDGQRRLPTESNDGGEKRIAVLRQRYAAANEMMNYRRETQRRISDAVSDLELMAVQAEREELGLRGDTHALEEHLEQLDIDLRALSAAHKELGSL
jgi:hypothetical protein